MRKSIMYVGLDQHKESIEIATADEVATERRGATGASTERCSHWIEWCANWYQQGKSCGSFMKLDHAAITSIDT